MCQKNTAAFRATNSVRHRRPQSNDGPAKRHGVWIVNANRRHYRDAAKALDRAEPRWFSGLISRRVPLARWREAFEHRDDDIKVVVDFKM